MSQVCDNLEKEYELSKAVQEVELTLSQTADDLELCDSVDFQILPDDWDWRFDKPEPSQPVLQPMTPKTEPNETSYDAGPIIIVGNVTPGLELAVSSMLKVLKVQVAHPDLCLHYRMRTVNTL